MEEKITDFRGYESIEFRWGEWEKDLRNHNFSFSKMRNEDFKGRNLTGAAFTKAVLENCNFEKANLKNVYFGSAKITNCKGIYEAIECPFGGLLVIWKRQGNYYFNYDGGSDKVKNLGKYPLIVKNLGDSLENLVDKYG